MPRRPRYRRYARPAAARVDAGTRILGDTTSTFVPALEWLGGTGSDTRGNAERRAEALVQQNRGILSDMLIQAHVERRSGQPGLRFQTSARIGAVPLRSPVSGRPDFGLVVTPRFPWEGVGDLLDATGLRVCPDLLPLPDLPQSEWRIPPWVLSSVVLRRIERLLDAAQRRFALRTEDRAAPRGRVDWSLYARTRFPRGRALSVPCTYPDLRDDEELRSAAHWTVRRHRDALLGQRATSRMVRRLLALCDRLLAVLAGSPPAVPSPNLRTRWRRTPLRAEAFQHGIEAIEWTADERGLAGLSDLAGLSWRLDMEVAFEAWVEALAVRLAQRRGGTVTAGLRGETRVPLIWTPPGAGSQRALLPDVVLRRDDVAVVLDAKYKRHSEQIERLGWHGVQEWLREQHRQDLLQVLAYAAVLDAPRVVAVLVYPCGSEAWKLLQVRRRTLTRARVAGTPRRIELALLAVPLGGEVDEAARDLEAVLDSAHLS